MSWLLNKVGIGSHGTDETWRIVWRSAPETWLLTLIIIPAVVIFSYLIYRKERQSVRFLPKLFLTLLRSAVILIALIILFQPVSILEKPTTKESTLAILIDDSLSMGLKDRHFSSNYIKRLTNLTGVDTDLQKPMSRIDIVNAILSNQKVGLLDKLIAKFKVKMYTFSNYLKPVQLIEKSEDDKLSRQYNIQAQGDSTGIGNAINDLINESGGHSIGALILLSDGQSNIGKNPLEIIDSFKQSRYTFPIYTVLVGSPESFREKDIELSELSAPDVGIVYDELSFNFTIKSIGFAGDETVKVILSERTVGEKQLTIVGEENIKLHPSGRQIESIKYKPSKQGDYIYEIKILPQKDEIIEENNSLVHHLKVVDNTIKILYVESYPRWEYRRLKNALIRDTTIRTATFLVSADPDFPQDASSGVVPLTQFPAEAKELFNYDVIIWGDVAPEHLSAHTIKLFENIKRFVDEMGAGIVFVCGERFNPERFRKTPLLDLLPLVLEDDDYIFTSSKRTTEPFKPKLTPEGFSDSIMRMEDNPSRNSTVRELLPGFFWFHPFKKAKPAARVLATHPVLSNKFGLRPIIATQFYGQGRTFLIATDETWRWCSLSADKYFYNFWREVIRYLRGGRLLGTRRIQIKTDKPKYSSGETVKIMLRLYDTDFKPLKRPFFEVSGEELEGLGTTAVKISLSPLADKEGYYEGSFIPCKTGLYKISGSLDSTDGKEVAPLGRHGASAPETSYTSFQVNYPQREYERPLPNIELMKDIAHRTKGAFLKITETDKLPNLIKPTSDIIYTETKEDDLWDTPMIFLIFLLVISAEWVIRKIIGLI
ncbi:MAG: hypothetical protein QME51_07680 [Planctomycetota bacterium]|nr:hypothetical protein [Planctomycetota bacterium]MDI6788236.1 hypothetical protein [Planctomycetota bacterium]